ncbi:GntR family transcriptional regulator [Streptomyces sp. TG1A-8]|uniref:GntR family transcriptional regulator n=1 Tax=Streptomyces sp. TG1A-8 TaxID=3051385 RepID=UPI00265C6117|nr:GntR family transcriptional regulator [Streptomyces sp. TG1A-8]MDO0929745.1 GntR family transcriptional regulator [Streptomyces sp. TG1A-8]
MTAPQTPSPRGTARAIADHLREQIRSGTFPPGAALPTSRELAETYGVTTKTVTAGIDLLKVEGLVVGERGGRRRVRSDRPITWNLTAFERGKRRDSRSLDDWSAAIKMAGRIPAQHVTVETGQASQEVSEWLEITPGQLVIIRTRLRTVDERPFQLSTSWFPGEIAVGTLLEEEGDVAVPGGILRHIGHPQLHVRDEIRIRMPSPEETDSLALPPGTPVAEHLRIGYGQNGPVRAMRTIAPGDRHVLVYEMDLNE